METNWTKDLLVSKDYGISKSILQTKFNTEITDKISLTNLSVNRIKMIILTATKKIAKH